MMQLGWTNRQNLATVERLKHGSRIHMEKFRCLIEDLVSIEAQCAISCVKANCHGKPKFNREFVKVIDIEGRTCL